MLAMGAAIFASVDALSGSTLHDQQQSFRTTLIGKNTGPAIQNLRICNAFSNESPLDITNVRSKSSVGSLSYKDCGDYRLQLLEGDQLGCKVAGVDVGSFAVNTVPQDSELLLLIVQKQHGAPIQATFTSHAFAHAKPDSAQVAVIDTYSGAAKNLTDNIEIYDTTEPEIDAVMKEHEALNVNSVMSIRPGSYEVALNTAAQNLTTAELNVEGNVDYVVLRVGDGTPSTPEELVVFPSNKGGARSSVALGSGLLLATFLQLFLM